MGEGRVIAVLPYFPCVRSEKKDRPRISIGARLVVDLLYNAGADRILSMDLHAPQIQGFAPSRMPFDHIQAGKLLSSHFRERIGSADLCFVAPDVGSAKSVRLLAKKAGVPLVIINKERKGETLTIENVIGIDRVKGRHAVMFDDELCSGGSIMEAVSPLEEAGALSVWAGVTHFVGTGEAVQKIEASNLAGFAATNTLPPPVLSTGSKIRIIDVAPMFAETIRRIHHDESVSALLG